MSTVQLPFKSALQNLGLAAGMMRPTRLYSVLDKIKLLVCQSTHLGLHFFLTFLSFRGHTQQKTMQIL